MSGYINMNKKLGLLLLFPLIVTSCNTNHATFDAVKAKTDAIPYSAKYPYYRVIGSLDFNGELLNVDATFDKTPSTTTFVPYARYNEGFYCPDSSSNERSVAEKYSIDDIKVFMMGSRSYWLRAPLRINADNFYTTLTKGDTTEVNKTCAHYILEHLITSYIDEGGSTNPSTNRMYYQVTNDRIIFGGDKVHTDIRIDNYPYYPDPAEHPELDEWDAELNPLPCYKSEINVKCDIRFEYNLDGWLVRESLSSIGYDYKSPSRSQVSLVANYTYKFSD